MNAALMISRFAQFGGVMLLFGISLFRLRFNPESDGRICLRWYRQAPIAAAIITMASSLAWLDFVAGTMGDDGSKAASLRTIAAVLFHTRFGHVWQWNLVAAAIVLCATLTSAKIQHVKPWAAFVVGLSAFLIATSAWTGHAVMDNGLTGAIHPLVQVVHVLAAAAWLGSLPALGFALHSAAKLEAAPTQAIQRLIRGYSRMGSIAVGLVLFTGCIDTWFMADSLEALFRTLYGRILVAKISLFLLMVGVAVVNRFIVTPAIMNSDSSVATTQARLRQLRRNIVIEQTLGLLIIALVSMLGTVPPPFPAHMDM